MSIFNQVRDPGPEPPRPGPKPATSAEQIEWLADVRTYNEWIRAHRRFLLAKVTMDLTARSPDDPVTLAIQILATMMISAELDPSPPNNIFEAIGLY